jgi:hypothetical protein
VVGGTSPGALRRAVSRGHGWYGFALDPDATAEALRGLERARSQVERPAVLGELELSVTPPPGIDDAGVQRYAELGVQRLVLMQRVASEDDVLRFVDQAARELMPAAR